MIALDASVLIAVLSNRDAHHERAVSLIQTHLDEALTVHPMTLAEILVGAIRVNKVDVTRRYLDALGVAVSTAVDDEPLRLAELRVETGLRMPDCCVLAAAQVTTAALATFDERLAAAARHLGLTVVA
jgi:predicted nucleic acid-binding protein